MVANNKVKNNGKTARRIPVPLMPVTAGDVAGLYFFFSSSEHDIWPYLLPLAPAYIPTCGKMLHRVPDGKSGAALVFAGLALRFQWGKAVLGWTFLIEITIRVR